MSRGGRPSVVAIGGGHGTAVTLKAARRYAGTLTGVVSVADDGGSSGRLRELLNVVALGDIRKCLVALADEDSALADAFERRFDEGELAGHALGNLILAGLIDATGDLVLGVREAAQPARRPRATCCRPRRERVVLKAESDQRHGGRARWRSRGRATSSGSPWCPGTPSRRPWRVERIVEADQIVIGPGIPVHQRAGRRGGAEASPRRWPPPRARWSTSATCARRSPRPRATT